MALADSLVSYWKLDESSGNATDSVGGNTGTNTGTVTYSPGVINNGAVYDGSTDYHSMTATTPPSDVSISFWFKANSDATNAGMMGWWTSANNSNGFIARVLTPVATARPGFALGDGAGNYRYYGCDGSGINMATNTAWHHMVVTQTGTSAPIVYIDGTAQTLTTVYTSGSIAKPSGSTALSLGREGAYTGADSYWPGMLDEVGIWSRVLTSDEVTELYNGGAGLQYPFGATTANTTNFFAFMDRR